MRRERAVNFVHFPPQTKRSGIGALLAARLWFRRVQGVPTGFRKAVRYLGGAGRAQGFRKGGVEAIAVI